MDSVFSRCFTGRTSVLHLYFSSLQILKGRQSLFISSPCKYSNFMRNIHEPNNLPKRLEIIHSRSFSMVISLETLDKVIGTFTLKFSCFSSIQVHFSILGIGLRIIFNIAATTFGLKREQIASISQQYVFGSISVLTGSIKDLRSRPSEGHGLGYIVGIYLSF